MTTTTAHPHPAIDAWLARADEVLATSVTRMGDDLAEMRDGGQRADVRRRRLLATARS